MLPMKAINPFLLVVLSTPFAGLLDGAIIIDDFSSDTSASYTGSDAFGGGGSFNVNSTEGTLEILAAGGNTYSVVLDDGGTFLEVGEYFEARSLTGVGPSSPHQYVLVSTSPSQPSATEGFRFRRSPDLRIQGGDAPGAATVLASPDQAIGLGYRIERESETAFEFLYDEGAGFVSLGTYNLQAADLAGDDIYVGLQGWAGSTSWDRLEIGVIPEPSSGILFLLGGGWLLGRRGRDSNLATRSR